MEYIEIIKNILLTHNLSQEKFANIIGVNQTTVGQWILGKKKPSFESILAIYDHFGITPNEIFGIDI